MPYGYGPPAAGGGGITRAAAAVARGNESPGVTLFGTVSRPEIRFYAPED